MVTMSDGVQLAVSFYEPTGTPPADGWPAVMLFHGLGETRNSVGSNSWSENGIAETYLAPDGYAVLTFDARAHGGSGGLFSLDGPRELQDTRELFAWLTVHPEIDRNRVGAFGVSLGAGMIWLATISGVPFRAIVPAASWIDLEQALAPQGLVRAGLVLAFAADVPQSRYAPELSVALKDALAGYDPAGVRAFLAERSPGARLRGLTVPTLIVQGRRDFAFDAGQGIAAYRLLRGPKRLYLSDHGHPPSPDPAGEISHIALEARAWFDRYVKDEPGTLGRRPQVELATDPWSGKTVTYDGLPATRTLRFARRGHSTLTASGKVVRTFPPVAHVETFGTPVVHVHASSRTGYSHLVVAVTAVRPNGSQLLLSDGGAATRTLGRKARTVTIRLPDEITSISRGSRLRVTIGATSTVQSPSNPVYLIPVAPGSKATIGRVAFSLPVLRKPASP
jgi:predicted acyl esterase